MYIFVKLNSRAIPSCHDLADYYIQGERKDLGALLRWIGDYGKGISLCTCMSRVVILLAYTLYEGT